MYLWSFGFLNRLIFSYISEIIVFQLLSNRFSHKFIKLHLMQKVLLSLLFLSLLGLDVFSQSEFDGYVLYNRQNQNTTYLVDKEGDVAYSWNCDLPCNYTVLLKNNGNIVRGAKNPNNSLGGAAEAGRVQEIAPDGSIVWEFTYSDNTNLSHHDITLVNDNVLLTAWEVKSSAELTQVGYDGSSSKWPTHFVEIANDGSGGGQIVWEWHLWDHLIQDFDATKDNFGVVADHPELFDINMLPVMGGGSGPGGNSGDWFHVNGVNYNAELDQIAFSSRHASEVFIIDHSTTSAQAASHSGGNSNQGGDLLYRWGNPSNYDAPGAQQIPSAVHDVRWITNDGRPNSGFLQFYNNDGGGNVSSIDAINTPINGFNYDLIPGQAFGPSSYTWRHTCEDYASGQSSHNRMSNGNVFVNMSAGQGGAGYMYEADSLDNVIWQFNAQGTPKAFRYECKYPGIIALLDNPCSINETSIEEQTQLNLVISPNPSAGIFTISGIQTTNFTVTVVNPYGQLIKKLNSARIDLTDCEDGIYFIAIEDGKGGSSLKVVSLKK